MFVDGWRADGGRGQVNKPRSTPLMSETWEFVLRTDPPYCQNGLEINVEAVCAHSISRVRRRRWWWRSVCLWPLYSTYTDSVQIVKDTIKHGTNHVHIHKQIRKMCSLPILRTMRTSPLLNMISWSHVQLEALWATILTNRSQSSRSLILVQAVVWGWFITRSTRLLESDWAWSESSSKYILSLD